MDEASPFDQVPGLELEKYYNRDSTKYVDTYNIPEVQTLIRGTLRYKVPCVVIAGSTVDRELYLPALCEKG